MASSSSVTSADAAKGQEAALLDRVQAATVGNHEAVAKAMIPKDLDPEDPNRHVNFGFLGADGETPQLQAVEHTDRKVLVLSCAPTKTGSPSAADDASRGAPLSLTPFLADDPPHDANKIYGVLAGLPRAPETHESVLEDLGVNERACRAACADPTRAAADAKGDDAAAEYTFTAFDLVGGQWLADTAPEAVRTRQPNKVLFAVSRAAEGEERFDVALFSAADVFAGSSSKGGGEAAPGSRDATCTVAHVESLLAPLFGADRLHHPGTLVIPVLQTQRLVGPAGVVFYG